MVFSQLEERIKSQLRIYPIMNRSMLLMLLGCRAKDLDAALVSLAGQGAVRTVSGVNRRSSVDLLFLAAQADALEPFLHGLALPKKKVSHGSRGRPRSQRIAQAQAQAVARAREELQDRINLRLAVEELARREQEKAASALSF